MTELGGAFTGIAPLAPPLALGVLSAAARLVLAATGIVALRAALIRESVRPA